MFLTFLTHPSAWDNCSDLAPVYSLRFCPAHEWNSGLDRDVQLRAGECQKRESFSSGARSQLKLSPGARGHEFWLPSP